jgi:CubicO group peptidase (beta-lactamase class C family)
MTAQGHVEQGFDGVLAAFEENFSRRGEVGAGVSVFHRGNKVVDLWSGARNSAGLPWEERTAGLWMSTTKGVTATVVLQLLDEGLLEAARPVAAYWPEFAQGGKQDVTVEQVLSHTSGVVALDPPFLTLDDVREWKPLVSAIEKQVPAWEPGTRHGYHAVTFGFIVDELSRRVTGSSVGAQLQERIAAPLGLDLWLGLPPEQEDRVADMVPPAVAEAADPRVARMDADLADYSSLLFRSISNPIHGESWDVVNTPGYHQVSLPSANAIGTPRAMAGMYAALVSGRSDQRLLSPEVLADATRPRAKGPDACLRVDSSWGLGYGLTSELFPFPRASCFGHGGSGGSFAFGDAENEIGFAYLPISMQRDFSDARSQSLMAAVYEAV